jgi:hypothetical protein
VADTRLGSGKTGAFGAPSLTAASPARDFPLAASGCPVPAAQAYALNITVAPRGSLGYLSAWAAGRARPLVSTLNSWDGRVLANAAIVPADANGAISVYTALAGNDSVDVLIDVNGYFAPPGAPSALLSNPISPCRAVDTRGGGLPQGFAGPSFQSGQARGFPLSQGTCSIPFSVQAYSLNATVVPTSPLYYLTLWPYGLPMPVVSTLNSFDGRIVANAAIVPASPPGAGVQAFAVMGVPGTMDLILDVNGFLAP